MESWKSYFHQIKPIEDIIKEATIVVDTNVLLSAYQWREVTVKEVLRILTTLSDQGRLKIPLQVVKEFSKNRTKELNQRVNDIEDMISRITIQKPLNQKVPMLEGEDIYNQTNDSLKKLNESAKEYIDNLKKIREEVKGLFSHDPYLEQLKQILKKSYFPLPESTKEYSDFAQEAESRFKNKIPPGYKDSSKAENSIGDYIIWYSILQIQNDVIFISGDKKDDWVYTDKQNNPISARRELVEEFYLKSEGYDFAHLTPKEFILMINPEVGRDITEDLNTLWKINYNNKKENKVKDYLIALDRLEMKITEILNEYKPLGIPLPSDEYSIESNMIVDRIDEIKDINRLMDIMQDVFIKMFSEDISVNSSFEEMATKIYQAIFRVQVKFKL